MESLDRDVAATLDELQASPGRPMRFIFPCDEAERFVAHLSLGAAMRRFHLTYSQAIGRTDTTLNVRVVR
jgi:hypothetical protein